MPQEDNAFAEYGTLCHKLLEDWALGNLMSFELADAYQSQYDNAVQHYFPSFPSGMGQRYFDAGLHYFSHFDGFGDHYSILAVEDKFLLDIEGFPFTGVIDLVLEDKRDGTLVVIDHKSKSAKVMRKQLETYTRQLYLYAAAVNERFGRYPARLAFNLFRETDWVEEAFGLHKLYSTFDWVRDTIHAILADGQWEARPSDYFCRFICSCGSHCPMI